MTLASLKNTLVLEAGGTVTVGSTAYAWVHHAEPYLHAGASAVAIVVGLCTLVGFICRFLGGKFCERARSD